MNCFLCLCGNADHLKQATPATTCLLPGSDPASWETGLRQKMWCRHRQRIGADAGVRQNSDSDPIANDPQTADRSTSTPWLRPTSPTQACVKTVKTVMQGQPSRTHRHNTQTLILILQVKFQNQNLMMSPIKMCARRGLSQWKKIESISRTVLRKVQKTTWKNRFPENWFGWYVQLDSKQTEWSTGEIFQSRKDPIANAFLPRTDFAFVLFSDELYCGFWASHWRVLVEVVE